MPRPQGGPAVGALLAASRLYFAAYLFIVVFGKNARMPHEKLSRTYYMAIAVPEENAQA